MTPDEKVARWAEERVQTGINTFFAPLVVRPSAVLPSSVSKMKARDAPELAAVSAIMHVGDRDTRTADAAFSVGLSALAGLPEDLARVCFDLFQVLANNDIRQEWRFMDFSNYEFQGELSKRLIAMGHEKGRSEGQAAMLIRQLQLRFGPLSHDVQARIKQASSDELDLISERVLTAPTLQQALSFHETLA